MDWMTNWIFDLLYGFQKTICYIIDFIKDIFYMLAGIEPVVIDGQESDILSHFLLDDTVRTIFWAVVLIGVVLLFVFVLVAIIRSEYANREMTGISSKAKIMARGGQSFLIFILIPFILIAGIMLANTIIGAINLAMNPYTIMGGEAATTIGGQILVTSGAHAYIGDPSIRAEIEMMFATGQLDYFDMDVVKQYYNLRSLDFFVGIVGGIVIVVMFIMSAVMFIQRIFDIIFLYIISPVSVSTIPVDDGNRFRMWKDMLISKVLCAYGIILTMNLFFIIIPQVQTIAFFNDAFKDGIVKILFVIGGAYAVTKANIVVAQLIGDRSSQNETQQLIANIRTAGSMTKGGALAVGSGVGTIIGGRAFLKAKKETGSRSQALVSSVKQKTSLIEKASSSSNKKDTLKMPTRLATMPVGVMKDLASGGLVSVGKNFVPRMRNVFTGSSVVNHPQQKTITKTKTEKMNENNT